MEKSESYLSRAWTVSPGTESFLQHHIMGESGEHLADAPRQLWKLQEEGCGDVVAASWEEEAPEDLS